MRVWRIINNIIKRSATSTNFKSFFNHNFEKCTTAAGPTNKLMTSSKCSYGNGLWWRHQIQKNFSFTYWLLVAFSFSCFFQPFFFSSELPKKSDVWCCHFWCFLASLKLVYWLQLLLVSYIYHWTINHLVLIVNLGPIMKSRHESCLLPNLKFLCSN